MKQIFIDRPPRIQPELPLGEHQIPKPPTHPQTGNLLLIEIGLPLVTIIGYVFVSAFAGGSLGLMIPMALSVVAAVAFSIYTIRQEKLKREQSDQAYANRLVELNKAVQTSHDLQRRFYRYNYPDVQGTARIVRQALHEARKSERTLRSESRLWERRTDDDDFGTVRLGVGTLPSTVVYRLGDIEEYDNPQARAALKLESDARFVSEIPVIISLRPAAAPEDDENKEKRAMRELLRTPVAHSVGVAGDAGAVYSFARALIASYAVFHPPADARLYLLANQRREWAWTDTLPHCRGDDQNRFRCFVSEIKEQVGEKAFDDDDGGELEQYLEGLRKLLAQRKIRLQEREGEEGADTGGPALPFLLLVVDLLDTTYDLASPLQNATADAALAFILEEGPALGAAVIFLVPERSKIPGSCTAVVEVERTTPATNSRDSENQKIHFRFATVGVNSPHYVGVADSVPDPAECAQLARDMASVQLRQGGGASLTSAVPFLDLLGHSSLDDLTGQAWRNWQASTEPRYANWLRAKIGMMSGNKPRTMVFSAKRDGVHGMVAGSTGSGKSELLISLIAAMAVTYDPSVLNFVLVDYKGGGTFKEFVDLPHCVDIITNLAADGVTRMFTAINAEMKRRQALNAETGTKNIVEYRQKALHNTHQPYPFLFIIIDEFAEMIADRAEYKAELESIARVGRAQGVSMLLAAQRPTGVTDQMRSNIKYRISLRVETPAESREMLRRADAAFLPAGIPGRGYLQVGNEEIELIQVAYSGDRYVDPKQRGRQDPVIWPDRRGLAAVATQDQQPPELYKAIIDSLNQLAQANNLPRQRAPWPGFLPRQLALSETLIAADSAVRAVTSAEYLAQVDRITLGRDAEPTLTLNPAINSWLDGELPWSEELDWQSYAMRPVIGLVDDPYGARQLPLVVDLPRGHVALFGASGSGKTTFVRTMIASLAATHSPSQFHAYLLDLGGRNLGVLGKLPHVGAVVIPDEEGYEERVEQILRELDELIERRKLLLSGASVPDIYQYNQAHPEAPLPAVVLAVDNFVEFVETFGGDAEGDNAVTVLEKFVGIARQSKPYGIHFLITATHPGVLSTQLGSLFSERLTLRLVDPTDYRGIVGVSVPEIGDIPGRGYVRIGREGLAFQVAIPVDTWRGDDAPGNEVREIERLVGLIARHVEQGGQRYTMPARVDALPKAVLFKQMLAREHGLELDASFLPRLAEVTRQRWAQSLEPARADWLKVAIGVVSGNRPRTLALEAKKDGVHGLVAGGTGAGKSELLMTLIVGLALNYDPSVLNFVLVDYKGGGAFKPFEKLPHCVDTITNLNKAAVIRFFTAIDAEMRRRQALNADTGTKDIVEYREKGLHKSHKPYPHLFIIIDEYAEMISANPEFGAALDSITRVGRSSGVNLLLAAQRPVGVSDQMRANIKLRMCLRVEGPETSREMLRRPDAAYLPNGMPGRGYLQVGNEQIELIQVAYTGETYPFAEASEGGEKPKFYDVCVGLCNDILSGPRPATAWPPFLPNALTFATPLRSRYLDPAYERMLTLDRSSRLTINPFLQDWLDGKGSWEGVDWSSMAMRAIAGLLDDPFNARQLPLVVDLARGHAVLFGASGWGKTTMLRSIVLSLAATHSPDEFQAHVFDLGGRNLESLKALPHVGTVIVPDERGYEERVQQLLRELGELVDRRKLLFSTERVATLAEYNEAHPDTPEPAVLVLVDNFGEFMETFGGGQADEEDSLFASFIALARQGRAYGLHVLITASRLNVLSSKLYSIFTERFTLRLADADDYSGIVGQNMPDLEEIAGRGYTRHDRAALSFQVALVPGAIDAQGRTRGEAQQIYAVGDQMTAFIKRGSRRFKQPLRIDALPKSSSYRQVLAEERNISQAPGRFLAELQASTAAIWARNAEAEHAEWLRATLGVTSGNRFRTLRLEAKRDGVHGMVAGGTGAGKSELLMTLIIGLALNYSPDLLNFVLVDYKGGGAFKPFEDLPHCVDIVTNLNVAAVERMFTAINAEIRRRQALNAETGTKDIVEYREKNLHKTKAPYPHLFVIIDEYAEMIDQNDAYLREIESITRVGRAQGVNLLLASQQPKGVTDQMRANIKLRLCLRVEQMDTSRELLRKPDAALLPNGMPGRGYLQIGNENLELIQVSWTGETQPDDRPVAAEWPDRPARPVSDEELPKFYDMVVRMTSDLVGGRKAPKPWPAFLPERFSLESILQDAQHGGSFNLLPAVTDWLNGDSAGLWPGVNWEGGALTPVIGLVDDPAEARQDPLRLDLSRSHLGLFGDAGSGKTTLLRTLLMSLVATHSPAELQLYIVDMGGRNFRSLEGLPHTGAVIYGDEETFEERLRRLLSFMWRTVDERQQLLSAADCGSLAEYNTRNPDRPLPAIVISFDNVAQLQESFPALLEDGLIPVARRSLNIGLTLVMASNLHSHLPSRLYGLMGERLTLKQSNADNYLDIVGRGAVELGEIPGRGYIRRDRRPLMFHAALPVGVLDAAGRPMRPEAEEVRRIADEMRTVAEARGYARPAPVRTLPENVPLAALLRDASPPQPRRVEAVLGLGENLQPVQFDLRRAGPHFMVVGPPLSGKTTALYAWVLSLAERYEPAQAGMVLVDLQRTFAEYGGDRSLAGLPHTLATITELEQLEALLPQLEAECADMAAAEEPRALFLVIDNFDDFNEELTNKREIEERLSTLVRRYGREGLHVVASLAPDGNSSDLRRRIQSANLGVGLRSSASLDALRVMRTPDALRNRELQVGRGFVVRSGQTSMIQIASPYDDDPGVDEEERRARSLDGHIERLVARYGETRAAWRAEVVEQAPAAEQAAGAVAGGPLSRQAERVRTVAWARVRREVAHLKEGNGNGNGELFLERLATVDNNDLQREEVRIELLRELYLRQQEEQGLDVDNARTIMEWLDEESLLISLENEEEQGEQAEEAEQ